MKEAYDGYMIVAYEPYATENIKWQTGMHPWSRGTLTIKRRKWSCGEPGSTVVCYAKTKQGAIRKWYKATHKPPTLKNTPWDV